MYRSQIPEKDTYTNSVKLLLVLSNLPPFTMNYSYQSLNAVQGALSTVYYTLHILCFILNANTAYYQLPFILTAALHVAKKKRCLSQACAFIRA